MALLLMAMPTSLFLMSISQWVLVGWFLFVAPKQNWWQLQFKHPYYLWIIAFFILHVLGLLHTADLALGLKDIKIKLPLLIIAVSMSAAPDLDVACQKKLLHFYLLGLAAGMLHALAVDFGLLYDDVIEKRSIFKLGISHIRFGLMLDLGILWIGYILLKFTHSLKSLFFYGVMLVWMVVFLCYAQLITGIIILVSIIALGASYYVLRYSQYWSKIIYLGLVLAVVCMTLLLGNKVYQTQIAFKPMVVDTSLRTLNGNSYSFDSSYNVFENGYRCGDYIAESEMNAAWQMRSSMNIYGKDKRGGILKFTLIRYLTSMGLYKDSAAVMQLQPYDIKLIEQGEANAATVRMNPLLARIITSLWELQTYNTSHYASGHSVAMRMVFWKMGYEIFKSNLWIGVGTGDLKQAFDQRYSSEPTVLSERFQLRAHQQYLSIAIAFGIVGLVFFIGMLLYMYTVQYKKGNTFFMLVSCITILSMFTEDTLETQAGATFVAWVWCVLPRFLYPTGDKPVNQLKY